MPEKTEKHFPLEKYALGFILTSLFLFFLWILFRSEGFVGDADSITHYRFARYSWRFPAFLLDHWAKPVFTLLASPFAQFGHIGVSIFNLLAGIASAWLVWLSAKKLAYNNRLLLPFLVFFTPIYTLLVISGQIEVLFGLFIMATVLLCLEKKYFWAAIVISFSHLVRTEGIIIIPIIGLYFLVIKQYRHIPWLFTGTLVYSIVGYFHFGDFFWLITQMPYTGKAEIYGTGSFWHYFDRWPKIFGVVNYLLIPLGILSIVSDLVRKRERPFLDETMLIILPFVMYFLAHAVMWHTGIGRSLGLYRYMVSIVPIGALLALRGGNVIFDSLHNLSRTKVAGYVAGLALMAIYVFTPFQEYRIPQKLDGMNKVMKQASEFILRENLDQQKVFYYDPAFEIFLNLDHFDQSKSHFRLPDPTKPYYAVSPGEIVIWEGHFMALDGVKLEDLQNSPFYEMLGLFEPEDPFTIFETDYKVAVFRRLDDPEGFTGP